MNKPGHSHPHSPKSIESDPIPPSEESDEKKSNNTRPFREGSAKDLHNVIERKRKARISYWISKLIEELPNKDPRRESMNCVLERSYEYIKQLKNDHQKIMDQKLPAVSTSEMKKLQENNRQMQSLLTRYSALLKMAGISLNAVPSDIEINSCKNHKIPEHQRPSLPASRPILPKPYHESSVNTSREVTDDASSISSSNASDSVSNARVRASKEPDLEKSPRGPGSLAITSPSLGSHVESKSVYSSGGLIDRVASTSRPTAAQVVTSKETRVAKILPHIKTADGLITFPQVIAPNTPQIVILRSNDNITSTPITHVASTTAAASSAIIGPNSNLALTGQGNLILGPQLLGLSASPTVVLPSGQIIMTQAPMSTSAAAASTSASPLILSSTFFNQSFTSASSAANSSSSSSSHSTATHTSVKNCANHQADQSTISASQQSNSLYPLDTSFDEDVRAIDDENDANDENDSPMTNDATASPASSSKTNVHKGARDQGTSASHCYISRIEESSQPQSGIKPASQSQVKSSTAIMKSSNGKVTAGSTSRKRKLLHGKSKFSHKKRRTNISVRRQVSQTKYLIEQALKSIQVRFHSSSKVTCGKKKQKQLSSNTSISHPMLSSPAEATEAILMLDNLSESNPALSPASVNSTSNSSLPNFLCLSPNADQLTDFLPKCASPVSHNDSVATVTEVSDINSCSKRGSLDNSRHNNPNTPITSSASASPLISSVSNFLNEATHQAKQPQQQQQQQQTRKHTRQARRSGVHLHSQTFESADQQQQEQQQQQQQQQQVQEQLSQSQQQTRRTSYMAESLIRQQPVAAAVAVAASARSQMANVTPHDVTFNSSVNTHGASRSSNSANNSTSSHSQSEPESSQLSNLFSDSNDHQTRVYSSPNVTSNRSISYSAERLINASQNSRRDESTSSSILSRHSFSGSNLFFDPPANLLPANDLFSFSQNDSRTSGLSLASLANESNASTFDSTFNPPCFASAGRNYLSPVPGVTHTPSIISTPISSSSSSSSSASSSAPLASFSAPSTSQSGVFSLAPLTTSHHLFPTHHSTSHNSHCKSSQRSSTSNGIMNNSLTSINPFTIASDFNSGTNPSFISVDASTPNHYPYIRNAVSSTSSTARSSDTSSSHVLPSATSTMPSFTQTITSSSSSSSSLSLSGPCVASSASTSSLPPPPNPYLMSTGCNTSASCNTPGIASSSFGPLSIASSSGSSHDCPRMPPPPPPPLFSNSLAEQPWAVSLHSAPVSRRLCDHRSASTTSHVGNSHHNGKSSKANESNASTSASSTSSSSASTTAVSSATDSTVSPSKGSALLKKNNSSCNSNKNSHNIIHISHNSSSNQNTRNAINQLDSHQSTGSASQAAANHINRRISGNSLYHRQPSNSSYTFDTRIHSNASRAQQLVSVVANSPSEGHGNSTSNASSSSSNGTSTSNNNASSNSNASTSVHSSSASSSISTHARNERTDGNFNYSNNSSSSSSASGSSSSSSSGNNGSSNNGASGNNGGGGGGSSTRASRTTVASSRTSIASSSSSSAPITSSNRTSGVTSLLATCVSSASNSLTPVTTVISSSSSPAALFAAVAAAAPLIAGTDQTSLTASSSTSSIPFTLTAVPPPPSQSNSTAFFPNILSDLLRPTSASAANTTSDVNHFSHASSHFAHQSSHLQNQSQTNLPHLSANCFHNVSAQQQQSLSHSEHSLSQSHHIQPVLSLDENNTPNTHDACILTPHFNADCYHHRQSINQTPFPSNGNIFPF